MKPVPFSRPGVIHRARPQYHVVLAHSAMNMNDLVVNGRDGRASQLADCLVGMGVIKGHHDGGGPLPWYMERALFNDSLIFNTFKYLLNIRIKLVNQAL